MAEESDDLDWGLLTRYLTGDLTPAEAHAVERWFEADPRHRELLDELRAVWTAAAGDVTDWDTDRAVAGLRQRALGDSERRAQVRGAAAHRPRAPKFALGRQRSWVAVAASVALVLGGGAALATFLSSRHAEPPVAAAPRVTDVATRRAQQAEVRLLDGTRVILGAASRLSYPSDFNQRERTVVLDGEAYFDVVHDAARPFRVRTAHGSAEDVGTAFVVRARGEAPAQVVVSDGIVVLRPAEARPGTRDSLVLTRGQLGRVGADGALAFRKSVNVDAYLAWTRGELVFQDMPLSEVAEELSRWYDADVRVADAAVGRRRFSGRFSRKALEPALRLVASVADVSVQRIDNGWMFR
jgi:transmembrane sensor